MSDLKFEIDRMFTGHLSNSHPKLVFQTYRWDVLLRAGGFYVREQLKAKNGI